MKKTLILLAALLSFSPLWADVFPKPEMGFSFIYNTESKPLIDADNSEQIQCTDNQCIESKPLSEYGVQKLYCTPEACHSVAYDYDGYQRLIIGFQDGTKRESNVFRAPDTLRSQFNVYVNEDGLKVEPAPGPQSISDLMRADAWISLLLILLLEFIAAYAYLAYTNKSFRALYAVFFANIITTASCWLVLAPLVRETAFLWISCVAFETLFVWVFNRRQLSLYDSLLLNLATNITSYSVGSIILFTAAPWLF